MIIGPIGLLHHSYQGLAHVRVAVRDGGDRWVMRFSLRLENRRKKKRVYWYKWRRLEHHQNWLLLLPMAATGLHVLSAVGLRIGEKHKLSVGVVVALPRVSVSVTAFSSEQRSAKSFRDYLEAARDFIRPEENSPSRWFSPLESKARCDRAPLLLFLPG